MCWTCWTCPRCARASASPKTKLPLLQRWIAAARIRWGLHAEHRQALDLPEGMAQNSWDFGLRRMLLGYAVGVARAWNGIEPLDEIGGLDAALLGPLMRLHEALANALAPAGPARHAGPWVGRACAACCTFFARATAVRRRPDAAAREGGAGRLGASLRRRRPGRAAALVGGARALAGNPGAGMALRQPFFAGGVTFASLMPMRAIPFRRVALLGMNDGDYPRARRRWIST
jgi:exodeoxyribonuclease V gamma subunit